MSFTSFDMIGIVLLSQPFMSIISYGNKFDVLYKAGVKVRSGQRRANTESQTLTIAYIHYI